MSESLDALWSTLAPDAAGLVAAIVVHAHDDRVLMLGYMNRDALAATLATRKVTFFSRSKQRLWQKGETSGHTLELASIRVDCDGDALLVQATPRGPTCHTQASSCFFKLVELPPPGAHEPVSIKGEDDGPRPNAAIDSLWRTILDRKAGRGMTNPEGRSYVRSLLDKGVDKINEKLREEAGELCDALAGETDERVVNEAADLLFHALVGLAARGLEPADVAEVLRARHGLSGIDEKNQR
ncbi:Phosphoribosyl-ATP pyrophosphatase [Enhygromyxa salina]|uniref:Histidine biosynthesis bifunctional protein HisIE n=1 Tax=Enhygromyxa salina TaxID=215803 RepID=A0A2S9YEL0_9BACT|nr:bifunctional phosphoribosyl-AMP cyclohydrolase/phosphoribosyl-ATP diphosphatase HisIE [Enhygromyxa salina]PRQ03550.1 Phosphoribosyl-ATP pyrophosphatase [Enhygromyxa salina]